MKPTDELAKILYEKLEHLDPGAGPSVEWADLPERSQELYRLCIEELAMYPHLWGRISNT